mmetsp:Transcript_6504/g.23048  ORF Transcript_6504/g.23048 Transcript_6504/m.23048 type:complete len:319 (+) Transcript_6504:77-1033(+)
MARGVEYDGMVARRRPDFRSKALQPEALGARRHGGETATKASSTSEATKGLFESDDTMAFLLGDFYGAFDGASAFGAFAANCCGAAAKAGIAFLEKTAEIANATPPGRPALARKMLLAYAYHCTDMEIASGAIDDQDWPAIVAAMLAWRAVWLASMCACAQPGALKAAAAQLTKLATVGPQARLPTRAADAKTRQAASAAESDDESEASDASEASEAPPPQKAAPPPAKKAPAGSDDGDASDEGGDSDGDSDGEKPPPQSKAAAAASDEEDDDSEEEEDEAPKKTVVKAASKASSVVSKASSASLASEDDESEAEYSD